MQDLNVTFIQADLIWEDIEKNLDAFDHRLINLINAPTDLVILPEMFNTGFTMNAKKHAEPMEGKTMQWLSEQAMKLEAVVTGSLIIKDNGNYYNRLIWMQPNGTYKTYDKRHLFRLTDEQKVYTAGTERLIVELKNWKVCPQVCYDLRFPVWSRNQTKKKSSQAEYDLLFYNANWPQQRNFAWKNLLKARAIENQSYVIGVNRVGHDGNDIYHSGDSAALNPLGEPIFTVAYQEAIPTITLKAELLKNIRKKYQFLRDADKFTIFSNSEES